jgi:hypothetical protein
MGKFPTSQDVVGVLLKTRPRHLTGIHHKYQRICSP